MKLLPLIGSLLISAAPVQAFETFEELYKACETTEENSNLCEGAANFQSLGIAAYLLCDLEATGMLTTEKILLSWDNLKELFTFNSRDPMWNAGAEKMLENLPDCSLKP
ncbi:hypothetical protein [Synechococcus sp. CC9616]|uniref:hypothetical protein n=1 Tax=Synechococcus sp. CC9616 TaxID=110663 RepID=UPI0012EBBCD7|nr:hypothetical protein [Synechococcus sp. CC9616]